MKKTDWKFLGWVLKRTCVWFFVVSTGALIAILPTAFAPEIYGILGPKSTSLFPFIIIYPIIWGGVVLSWGMRYGNQKYRPKPEEKPDLASKHEKSQS